MENTDVDCSHTIIHMIPAKILAKLAAGMAIHSEEMGRRSLCFHSACNTSWGRSKCCQRQDHESVHHTFFHRTPSKKYVWPTRLAPTCEGICGRSPIQGIVAGQSVYSSLIHTMAAGQ